MMELLLPPLTVALIAAPGCLFLALATGWLLDHQPTERMLARITLVLHVALGLILGYLAFALWRSDSDHLLVDRGRWFTLGDFGIPIAFLIDRVSLTMAALTVGLAGIVASFSARYMHRDPGFFRFFLLLNLFTFGALVLFLSASLDLLFGGWELVGLSSVLLVGFFQYRRDPLRNAVRVFAAYRLADLQIVIATVLAHHWFGDAKWSDMLSGTGSEAAWIVVLLLVGACGKSAQGPFFGWLARAMEGPTPSSAVFYGAISVHAGAFLLLRVQPLIAASEVATALVIGAGLATALVATVAQRTRPDAKTSLAYAAQTQVGLIFVEIGLGWTGLALLHIVGHAMLRTMQFLRAPSLLHDHHKLHAAAGGQLRPADPLFARLPLGARYWLYRFGMAAGHYDAFMDRFVVAPVMRIAKMLAVFERGPRLAEPLPKPRTTPVLERAVS